MVVSVTEPPIQPSLRKRIGSIDELAQTVRDWSLDFRQIDAGTLNGELAAVADAGSTIMCAGFGRKIEQRGCAPAGMRTVAVLAEGVWAHWHGRDVGADNLLIFDDLQAVSPPGFTVYTLSFSEERLTSVAEELGYPEVMRLVDGPPRAFATRAQELRALRGSLSRLLGIAPNANCAGGKRTESEALAFEIPAELIRILATHRSEIPRPPSRVRDLVRDRALSFIDANVTEALTVRDLCRACECGERTIEYAFREHFGLAPKAYLRTVRLNAARHALRRAAPPTKVADLANAYGFWHMGQFAADYRKQFGELPSETLAKSLR